MKIWKYPVNIGKTVLSMPSSAKILAVQEQDNEPVLWAFLPDDKDVIPVEIQIFATGQPISTDMKKLRYLSTFQLHQGRFVGHAFLVRD